MAEAVEAMVYPGVPQYPVLRHRSDLSAMVLGGEKEICVTVDTMYDDDAEIIEHSGRFDLHRVKWVLGSTSDGHEWIVDMNAMRGWDHSLVAQNN